MLHGFPIAATGSCLDCFLPPQVEIRARQQDHAFGTRRSADLVQHRKSCGGSHDPTRGYLHVLMHTRTEVYGNPDECVHAHVLYVATVVATVHLGTHAGLQPEAACCRDDENCDGYTYVTCAKVYSLIYIPSGPRLG